jgi:DNA-binding NarL/FixJ family response regulator
VTVGKIILLVDDNPIVRLGARRILEVQPGVSECHEAVDGIDAIEKAKSLNPDLIILDLSMPRMNGLAAALKLKAMKTGVKIILFTMYADAVPPDVAEAAGISAVVLKTDLPELKREALRFLAQTDRSQ